MHSADAKRAPYRITLNGLWTASVVGVRVLVVIGAVFTEARLRRFVVVRLGLPGGRAVATEHRRRLLVVERLSLISRR